MALPTLHQLNVFLKPFEEFQNVFSLFGQCFLLTLMHFSCSEQLQKSSCLLVCLLFCLYVGLSVCRSPYLYEKVTLQYQMVTKTYLLSNLCDSSDRSYSNEISDSIDCSDSSDSRDSINSSDRSDQKNFFFYNNTFFTKKRLFFTQKFHIKTFFSPIIFFY